MQEKEEKWESENVEMNTVTLGSYYDTSGEL